MRQKVEMFSHGALIEVDILSFLIISGFELSFLFSSIFETILGLKSKFTFMLISSLAEEICTSEPDLLSYIMLNAVNSSTSGMFHEKSM